MKGLGQIAFCNDGGLGIQTKRLYNMLKPDKVMIVDSTGFSKNKQLHLDWYPNGSMITNGFPKNCDINEWLDGLSSVIAVENPYNFYLIHACRERGIKTFIQTNYEFCENVFAPWLPVPTMFLMPSCWKLKEMREMFGEDRVIYLPPPLDPEGFKAGDTHNTTPHFLHIVGTLAFNDRNGTLELLKAIKVSKGDYKITIHSQHELPDEYIIDDPRVIYRIKNFKNNADLYKDFDALILPRRYGGLSLTTNEALMSGLPVMMTDVSPNTELLPKEWLVPVVDNKPFNARALIDSYTVDTILLANKMDEWAKKLPNNSVAHKIALDNFSVQALEERYRTLLR